MRKTVGGIALVVVAALLTGCGGGADEDSAGKKDDTAKSPVESTADDARGGKETREVTLEVQGDGKTQVFYVAGTTKSEQVTLPWKKTTQVTLEGVQLKVGIPVSIVPGPVQGSDGQFKAAPCVIKVDGKKVADNQGGESEKGCQYTVK
ncbi:hypothetical protein [Streptomyces gobiensis]|uniref:hypothetical protein n=1 Tax=Streptomyces gobiensis TaxID=2875706 RepID=UPI001E2E0D69|nr:hypothetical protein [Streptomyces gobiensis]UGY92839.1 hypothetical protein test1122_14760 [Streptomyces gobiensis]